MITESGILGIFCMLVLTLVIVAYVIWCQPYEHMDNVNQADANSVSSGTGSNTTSTSSNIDKISTEALQNLSSLFNPINGQVTLKSLKVDDLEAKHITAQIEHTGYSDGLCGYINNTTQNNPYVAANYLNPNERIIFRFGVGEGQLHTLGMKNKTDDSAWLAPGYSLSLWTAIPSGSTSTTDETITITSDVIPHVTNTDYKSITYINKSSKWQLILFSAIGAKINSSMYYKAFRNTS